MSYFLHCRGKQQRYFDTIGIFVENFKLGNKRKLLSSCANRIKGARTEISATVSDRFSKCCIKRSKVNFVIRSVGKQSYKKKKVIVTRVNQSTSIGSLNESISLVSKLFIIIQGVIIIIIN